MPEEIKPEPIEVETFQDISIKDTEEELADHQHTGLDGSPTLKQEDSLSTGTGGKYLNQVSSAVQFSTTSTTYVDITDMTITKDIDNRRVLLMFSGCDISNATIDAEIRLIFNIDGGGPGALAFSMHDLSVSTVIFPVCMFWVTSVLTGTHTFKIQMKTSAGTANLNGYGTMVFTAIELTD